jgi:DNA excision repair protein ERCC-6
LIREPHQPLPYRVPELINKTPFELFRLYFTDELVDHLVTETNRYAASSNNHAFHVSHDEMMKFCGIFLLSGYHQLPQQNLYWSVDEDVGVPFVSQQMPRNRFTAIKQYLHLANNDTLDKHDRAAKVRPYLDIINRQLTQFGVFAADLSGDEQMVPYFGHHTSKMFMKNKPVKFGFKFWVLASSDGYPFIVILYIGKDADRGTEPLGSFVIKQLLQVVDNPACHTITFDNFFNSYQLLCDLRERGIAATGTVRENRLQGAPLPKPAQAKKLPRGSTSFASDGKVVACSWVDNRPVYCASNFRRVNPKEKKSRYSQQEKKYIQVDCPLMIAEYNRLMGGVDLNDRFLSNYRPTLRGRKWYFPIFTHGLNLCVVAAWRVHVHLGGNMSHLSFLREIVRCLLKTEQHAVPLDPRTQLPDIRYDGVGHRCVKGRTEGRCKLAGCKNNTFFRCSKCNQRLHQKCFVAYHTHPL